MTTTVRDDPTCTVCPLPKSDHSSAGVHHHWADDGVLRPKRHDPEPDHRNLGKQIRVAAEQTTAARLAAIMHKRGMISDADLVYVLTGGHDAGATFGTSPLGDIPPGQSQGSS